MTIPRLRPEQFAFRTTATLRNARDWPATIWKALAATAGVSGPIEEDAFGAATRRHPPRLDGRVELAANILTVKGPQAKNGQLITMSFAAFSPETGELLGWSDDYVNRHAEPGLFGGWHVVDGLVDYDRPVIIDPKFLRRLQQEGKELALKAPPA